MKRPNKTLLYFREAFLALIITPLFITFALNYHFSAVGLVFGLIVQIALGFVCAKLPQEAEVLRGES